MTNEKLLRVLDIYIDRVRMFFHESEQGPQRADTGTKGTDFWAAYRHIWWMCEEAKTFVTNNRIEKAMRWLGFIQGVLWARGIFSIDEMAEHNKPDAEAFCPTCHGNKTVDGTDVDGKTPIKAPCPRCVDKPVVSA